MKAFSKHQLQHIQEAINIADEVEATVSQDVNSLQEAVQNLAKAVRFLSMNWVLQLEREGET